MVRAVVTLDRQMLQAYDRAMIVSQETALLLWILRPTIDPLLVCYRIPPADGIEILEEVLRALDRKWAEIGDRPEWLLRALRHCCLAYWRQRRRRVYIPVGSDWLLLCSSQVPP